jgi:citrate lyase beta subunit
MAKSPRRSFLFTPGDSHHKINKVAEARPDAVMLDLEDAVAVGQKEQARQTVAQALVEMDFGRAERLVRINGLATEFFAADLGMVTQANVDGIVAPKIESAGQVQQIDQALTAGEGAAGRPAGAIRLFVMIETALGVLNVQEIAQASPRLEGLLLGAEDLAADMRATRSKAGWEILFARSALVTTAAAYGLAAIDAVFLDLHDQAGLADDASFAQHLGFTGKFAIHPDQVKTINRVFSPSTEEIAQAERLVAAFQAHEAAGSGVFALDGRMVDRPILLAAKHLLERALLAGMLGDRL